MAWFKESVEIDRLREEVRNLRDEVYKIKAATTIYQTQNPLQSFALAYGCPVDNSVSMASVVYGILNHLGLEVRKVPERQATVAVEKPSA